jgi:hypothetical protein
LHSAPLVLITSAVPYFLVYLSDLYD